MIVFIFLAGLTLLASAADKLPNIDRLGTEELRFTDAHAPAAVGLPTRYGLLTGRYSIRRNQFSEISRYDRYSLPGGAYLFTMLMSGERLLHRL